MEFWCWWECGLGGLYFICMIMLCVCVFGINGFVVNCVVGCCVYRRLVCVMIVWGFVGCFKYWCFNMILSLCLYVCSSDVFLF